MRRGGYEMTIEVSHGLLNDHLPSDQVGMLEGLTTTRTIRRYLDEPVPERVLRAMLFAATRAPSGSNRQPFRFIVLTDGPRARAAKQLIKASATEVWRQKQETDGYGRGSGSDTDSPKARLTRAMTEFVENFDRVPVVVLPTLVRYREAVPTEGASIYPACQNLLLAARALGYGGALTGWQAAVEDELRTLLGIPDGVFLAGTITIGKPAGRHGPVRRRPLSHVVFDDGWGRAAEWAVDPPDTKHTEPGPTSRSGRDASADTKEIS
jgi:nitroreductase